MFVAPGAATAKEERLNDSLGIESTRDSAPIGDLDAPPFFVKCKSPRQRVPAAAISTLEVFVDVPPQPFRRCSNSQSWNMRTGRRERAERRQANQ